MIVAGALALTVAACSSSGTPPPPAATAHHRPAVTATSGTARALGSFLAANVAEDSGDSGTAASYYARALAADPDNPQLLSHAFTTALLVGKVDQSLPMARRLLTEDPHAPLPALTLAIVAAHDGRFTETRSYLAAIPVEGANGFLEPLLNAWALAGLHRPAKALAALKPLSANRILRPLGIYHAALIDDLMGRRAAAERGYKRTLSAMFNVRSVEALGSFYQRTGQLDRARALYRRYALLHPDGMAFDSKPLLLAGGAVPPVAANATDGMAESLFDMAQVVRDSGNGDVAMVFLRLALYLRPQFPLAQMMAANILETQGHTDQALAFYRDIPATSPLHAFAQVRVAIGLDETGESKAALALLDRLAKTHGNSVDLFVARGDILRRLKRYDAAREAYTEAIKVAPPDLAQLWALYFSRGVCFERTGPWSKAEADLLHALKLQPDQPAVLNYLGYSWVVRNIHLHRAEALIERAERLSPQDGAILDSLGWAQYHLGQYEKAVTTLERAVEFKPEDPTINEHLGDAYWRVGWQVEARRQWTRALKDGPAPEQIEGLKTRLKTGAPPADAHGQY